MSCSKPPEHLLNTLDFWVRLFSQPLFLGAGINFEENMDSGISEIYNFMTTRKALFADEDHVVWTDGSEQLLEALWCKLSLPTSVAKALHSHPGCPASGGEASIVVQWAGTGWGQFRNRGFQPARALWDVSTNADGRAQRVRESCSSSGRAHTETDSQPEERETRCCWHYEREEAEHHSQDSFLIPNGSVQV